MTRIQESYVGAWRFKGQMTSTKLASVLLNVLRLAEMHTSLPVVDLHETAVRVTLPGITGLIKRTVENGEIEIVLTADKEIPMDNIGVFLKQELNMPMISRKLVAF